MKIVTNRQYVYLPETVTSITYTLFIGHYLMEQYTDGTHLWFHASTLPYRPVDIKEQVSYLDSKYFR